MKDYLYGIKKWRKHTDPDGDYFIFLFNITELGDKYMQMCEILHSINFTYDADDVPMDENRLWDGKAMRSIFAEEMYPANSVMRREYFKELNECFDKVFVSFFEVLVGLAWRMERDIAGDPDEGDRTDFWIECMLDNLGLMTYTNQDLEVPGEKEDLFNKVHRCIDREYDRFGNGGLFPVENPRKNFVYTELWNQMVQWLEENDYV